MSHLRNPQTMLILEAVKGGSLEGGTVSELDLKNLRDQPKRLENNMSNTTMTSQEHCCKQNKYKLDERKRVEGANQSQCATKCQDKTATARGI